MTDEKTAQVLQKVPKPVIATTAGFALGLAIVQFGHTVYSELRDNITRIEHTMAECVARNEDHLTEAERWKDEIIHHRQRLSALDRTVARLEGAGQP